MLAWNKNRLGAIAPEKIVVENGLRRFLRVADASLNLDAMCLYDAPAPVVQSGTRAFFTQESRNCTTNAWASLIAEQDRGNTILVNTVTSTYGRRYDLVVTNSREAVELLAQPAGAYAILGDDLASQRVPAPTPSQTKKKDSGVGMAIAGAIGGGLLGLAVAGPAGAALGGAAGAFVGSLAA